ncbi:MAG: hypothetical protein OXQ89_05490 [Rhodospirillaceae bacterium]|nr:hypothetical protein [Rhodospirillaceae bacterium]MDD9997179.1 hypothetical protein [Rhodospirillaceae bacterium]
MKIEISKEWCRRMAQHEGDAEIGAGRLAVDAVFDDDQIAQWDADDKLEERERERILDAGTSSK